MDVVPCGFYEHPPATRITRFGLEVAIRRSPPIETDCRPGFHTGHTAKAFNSKQVHTASDVFVDVEFVPWPVIAVDDGCAASIPLVNQGAAFGALNLYFGQSRELTKQRLELLATIAASATPAIQNAIAREQFAQPCVENELDAAA